jgi:hypothetical protein
VWGDAHYKDWKLHYGMTPFWMERVIREFNFVYVKEQMPANVIWRNGEADWTKKSWNPNEVVMFRMLIHISSFHPSGAHNFAHNIVFRRHTRRHSPGFEPKRHGRVRLCALPGVS